MRLFHGRFTIPITIFIASFITYTLTLYPGVATADNGEFQWIVATLGVAHPPGFPLYTILGYIFVQLTTLFGISPAQSLNLFAALTSAATLTIVYAASRDLIKQVAPSDGLCRISALIPTVILATSTTFWAQATVANIRSLTALFAAIAFYALVNIRLHLKDWVNRPYLHLFILATALGLTHHLSLAFSALIMTIGVALLMPHFFVTPKKWGWPILLILCGFLPWLYLPWQDPTLRQPAEFFTYALGLGFQGDFFYYHTAVQLIDRAKVMGNVLTFQFPIWFLILALLGWVRLASENWRQAFLLGGTFLIHTAVTATYRAPQTVEYMLPAYLPLVMCAGVAMGSLAQLTTWTSVVYRHRTKVIGAALAIATALIAQHATPTARSLAWLSEHGDTAELTETWLETAPQNSVILADWHWYTPLKYLQDVEGMRPDVLVEFVFPRSESYAQDWVNQIEAYLSDGRPVISTHYDESRFNTLPTPQAHHDLLLYPQTATTAVPGSWTAQSVTFSDGFAPQAHDYAQKNLELGETLFVDLAWTADTPINISLKLFGSPWQAYAQDDQLLEPQADGLTLSRFRLTPRLGAPQGEYTILVTATRQDGSPLTLEDGNTAAPLGTVNFTASQWRPYSANRNLAGILTSVWSSEPQIIGHDWDNSWPDAPRLYIHWRTADGRYRTESIDSEDDASTIEAHGRRFTNPKTSYYVPFAQGIVWTGSQPSLANQPIAPNSAVLTSQTLHATRPVQRDIGIATRLIGYEDDLFTWAWLNPDEDNDIPALGAIPTLKWISGTTVHHPRRLTIGSEARTDQEIGGFLRLYDVFTNRPLPILDERYTEQNRPWVTFDRGVVQQAP